MKVAFVWYHKAELHQLRAAIDGSSRWELSPFHEDEIVTIDSALSLVDGHFDIAMIHLSLSKCLALRLAEYIHNTNKRTKLVLFTGSHAEATLLEDLFDYRFDATTGPVDRLVAILEDVVARARLRLRPEELKRRIVALINDDPCLAKMIRDQGDDRHASRFDYADYRRTVDAAASPRPNDIFLSYSALDSEVALHLKEALEQSKLQCFMAERSLCPGERWDNRLRRELRVAREVLFLFTKNSVASKWVLTELGAAWALEKPVVPCTRGIVMSELPGVAQAYQARALESHRDMAELSQQIAARLGKGPRPNPLAAPSSFRAERSSGR